MVHQIYFCTYFCCKGQPLRSLLQVHVSQWLNNEEQSSSCLCRNWLTSVKPHKALERLSRASTDALHSAMKQTELSRQQGGLYVHTASDNADVNNFREVRLYGLCNADLLIPKFNGRRCRPAISHMSLRWIVFLRAYFFHGLQNIPCLHCGSI